MKANELMLWDLVYVPHKGKATHHGKVTALLSSGAVEVEINGSMALLSSVRPILLTTEILEKNGYDNNEGEENFYHKSNDLSICRGYGEWWGIYIRKGCRFEKSIRYVHELQHALSLCGIEKEIVL